MNSSNLNLLNISTADNSTIITNESWFIFIDILSIVFSIIISLISLLFFLNIFFDKCLHTIPMVLVANSCLAEFLFSINLLSASIYTLNNDIKQIKSRNLYCIFRCYTAYIFCAALNYSYLLQGIYRYIIVMYPTNLFNQSKKIQLFLIGIKWCISCLYPMIFLLNNEIIYNVDNQICYVILRISFSLIYAANILYIIPVLLIILIYYKLVRYVQQVSKRIISIYKLSRVQRELKMIRQTVILVMVLFTLGFPDTLFTILSFFNIKLKYHLRINFIFLNLSLLYVLIFLFQFTEPLKRSLIKRIKKRSNMIIANI